MQVLIADELPDICIEILEKAGLKVLKKPGIKADELKNIINDCEGRRRGYEYPGRQHYLYR